MSVLSTQKKKKKRRTSVTAKIVGVECCFVRLDSSGLLQSKGG